MPPANTQINAFDFWTSNFYKTVPDSSRHWIFLLKELLKLSAVKVPDCEWEGERGVGGMSVIKNKCMY